MGRSDAWHAMALVYVACGLALVAYSGVLFVFQRAVGTPARVRSWMNPFVSPLIWTAAFLAFYIPGVLLMVGVSHALSVSLEPNTSPGEEFFTVGFMVLVVAVAFLAARWWQPLYLAGVTVVVAMAGVQEEQTISGEFEEIIQVALLVGALASIGVLLRFAHMARSQRQESRDTSLR